MLTPPFAAAVLCSGSATNSITTTNTAATSARTSITLTTLRNIRSSGPSELGKSDVAEEPEAAREPDAHERHEHHAPHDGQQPVRQPADAHGEDLHHERAVEEAPEQRVHEHARGVVLEPERP